MSDYFQSYVFKEAPVGDVHAGLLRVTAYLIDEQIIGQETADNVLSEEEGHVPGARASSIVIEDNDHWRALSHCGVAFSTGRIIEASTELSSGRCPHCGVEIEFETFAEAYDALDAYHEGLGDELVCSDCGAQSALSDWDFGHGLAVGTSKVTFWNWPLHVEDLTSRFEAISGSKCKKVWGKL